MTRKAIVKTGTALRGWRRWALGALTCAGSVCGGGVAGEIDMPVVSNVAAKIIAGEGDGTISVGNDKTAILQATATKLGDYAENWKYKAAVFDYRLPQARELSLECRSLSLEVNCPYEKNGGEAAQFRVLIEDSRGGTWAVATRLQGSTSKLPYTKGFERIATYPWDASELGRIDRWVMMSLDPSTFDEYDPPRPPLKLVGFRVILPVERKFYCEVRGVREQAKGQYPDPYWHLDGDRVYEERLNQKNPVRFGWGPDAPAPYLRASDLNLAVGKDYQLTWEVLDAQEWRQLASGEQAFRPASASDAVAFPLMPNGTYRLRLYVLAAGEKDGREFCFRYMMLRNSRGDALPDIAPAKPLSFSCGNPEGNLFAPGQEVKVTVVAHAAAAGGTLSWSVESPDGKKLQDGSDKLTGTEGKSELDLTALAAKEPSLWLTAKLTQGERVVDIARRVVAVVSPEPERIAEASAVNVVPGSKLGALASQMRRTKGDWHEGGTSAVVRFDETKERLSGWLDEAKEIGYNIVELSASWYDLEPLPQAYQFVYLDKLVEDAKSRGFAVVLRVHPNNANTPAWVAREFQQDQNRMVHGIWHGGANVIYSPASTALRSAQNRFLTALAAHYRQDPKVIGYTLSNVFFDHGFNDTPWLGGYVDYSEAMRHYFVSFLRGKYGEDLAAVCRAHKRDYTSWEQIALPEPGWDFDAAGRVKPSSDPAVLDYLAAKVDAAMTFRTGAIEAMRKGDPACIVGPYSDTVRAFLEPYYTKNNVFIAQGSMESQYPALPGGYIVRSEPHAKVSRTALTTDIGFSNLMFYTPDRSELFNYWFPEWRLATVKPDIQEAEARLKQWFAACDRMAGAKHVDKESERLPLLVASLETNVYNWRHVHGRIVDTFSPYETRASAEGVRVDRVYSPALTKEELAGRPYVYVPFASDTLTEDVGKLLVAYVRDGGKLVLEPTSGFWRLGAENPNALGGLLGLPEAVPVVEKANVTSVNAAVERASFFAGVPLAFRVKEFKAPIDDQPVAWIDTTARCYWKRCRLNGALPENASVVARIGKEPAAYTAKFGKGEVLFFAGSVDWSSCPGLALRVQNWGLGLDAAAQAPNDPVVLQSPFVKGDTFYMLGRRFIHHALISKLKNGTVPDECAAPEPMVVTFPQAEETARYRVRGLLDGKELGVHEGKALKTTGVTLPLRRGEAFVLEAVKESLAK